MSPRLLLDWRLHEGHQCLVLEHPHRCGKRLTGSSVVIHLYQVAILDYEISGISEY